MTPSAERMAAAYFDAIEALCRATPKGWYAERGTARAGVTRASLPTLNCVYSTTLDPDLEALDELADEVGRLAVPWSIMVRGEAGDAVVSLAARHGLCERGALPFMACAAEDVVFRAGEARRNSVRAIGAIDSDRYTRALTEGFDVPEGTFGTLMGGDVLDAAPMTGYLAEVSGRPVGTGLGTRGPAEVGVFNVAVVASARGRGLGRAITEAVVADGLAAGADAAYLHASAMGRPLYESMGFRPLETWTVFRAR